MLFFPSLQGERVRQKVVDRQMQLKTHKFTVLGVIGRQGDRLPQQAVRGVNNVTNRPFQTGGSLLMSDWFGLKGIQ